MQKNDQQYGKPFIQLRGLKSAIEAIPSPIGGMFAFGWVTDPDVDGEPGWYDEVNAEWVWGFGTGGGAVDSVNGQTGVVVLDPDDLDDSGTTNKFTTSAEISKLAGIETGADVTDIANVGSALNGASADTPLDADTFHFWDVVDAIMKDITWANIKSTLKTYFDAYYSPHPSLCEARLSLSSTLPISGSLTGQGTLYLHPFGGNRISLYDSAKWVEHTLPSAISFTLSGVATASTCYDIFVYDNAGTLTLDLVAWTNATTRATALATQDGVYVKSGATGRKYIGTLYVDGSKQCSHEFSQTNTTTTTKRYLWNYYNRRETDARHTTTNSHTYNSATFRKWNNTNETRHEIVVGVKEDLVKVFFGGNQHTNASIDVALNWSSGGGSFLDWFNSATVGISAFSGGGLAVDDGLFTLDVVQSSTGGLTATYATCVLDVIVWN